MVTVDHLLRCMLCTVPIFGAYSPDGQNIAVYWGQSASRSLGEYCNQRKMDIAIIAFVNGFGSSTFSFNFGSNCDGNACNSIARDIKICQSKGIKVLLSLGGSAGSYSLKESQASDAADALYNSFGPKGKVFEGAQIDGIDLDIEHGEGEETEGYVKLVENLKTKFGGNFLISAAPQCVLPDVHMDHVLRNADIDMAFVQFYNNECSIDKKFNWEQWSRTLSAFHNKKMKLYIGIPGSPKAAPAGGFVSIEEIDTTAKSAMEDKSFGGFMVWDAATADTNQKLFGFLRRKIHESYDEEEYQDDRSDDKNDNSNDNDNPEPTSNGTSSGSSERASRAAPSFSIPYSVLIGSLFITSFLY